MIRSPMSRRSAGAMIRRRHSRGALARDMAISALLAAAMSLTAACAPAPTPNVFFRSAEPTDVGPFDDATDLVRYLEGEGWTLPEAETLSYDWFDVPGLTFALNEDASNALIIHTFPTAEAAAAAADTLTNGAKLVKRPDGTSLQIAWPDAPHVYLHGPLLVIYVGALSEIMHVLTLALGPQVEGPVPPPGVGVR